ncbi:MAG: CaiB/BaiF CoA transferase family protein [Coriobacteriales bacterium]|jgi:L-carnitine CoA-transferase
MSDTFKPMFKDLPAFGALQGIRILDCGSFIAVPWACTLAAECGAEVIKVENPNGDTMRSIVSMAKGKSPMPLYWAQDARCKLDMVLDYRAPEAKEIMAKLIERSDIWLESSIPGTFPDKFGITDEWILSVNPKIVVVHVSGYGQTGDPEYVHRGSYDMIGQAFSGFCDQNGFPDGPPMRTGPAINDYLTAVWVLWSMLAGYISAQRTGKGQVIDVAQYECQFRMMETLAIDYYQFGIVKHRSGNEHPGGMQPYGIFPCKDGYVCFGATGPAFQRVKKVIPGLDVDKYSTIFDQHNYKDEIKDIVEDWLKDKTGEEAEKILNAARVPACRIMDMPAIAENSQYAARDMLVEWDDPTCGHVKGVGLVPKFRGTPGRIWRGAPELGMDTEEIMEALGYSKEEIKDLMKRDVIE